MTVATPPPKPAEEHRAPTGEVREPRPLSRAPIPSDPATRRTAIGCLLGIAITHAFEVESKLDSAPYVGVMFVALIGGATVLALMLAKRSRLELAWPAAALLGVSSIAAYLWSRGIGLPGLEDHIGHWNDPLGTAALVFEATLVGLSLPALRRRTLRFSTAATFLAAGLAAAGIMLAGGGDAHGEGAGHEGMDIDAATRDQQAQAGQFLAATTANARQRFPTFDAARAAGYDFAPRSFEQQKDLDYWHVTNHSYLKDKRDLDPARPESLMYWNDRDGRPQLIAAVFRMPTRKPNPALGGPIVQWHVHRNSESGLLGRYKMTHLWMLPRLRDAYSMSMPTKRLQERFEDLPDNGSGAGG